MFAENSKTIVEKIGKDCSFYNTSFYGFSLSQMTFTLHSTHGQISSKEFSVGSCSSHCIQDSMFPLETQVFSVSGHACRTEDSPPFWGLPTVLRAVNTESLMIFHWLLSNISSDAPLNESEDYSVSIVLASIIEFPWQRLASPFCVAFSEIHFILIQRKSSN